MKRVGENAGLVSVIIPVYKVEQYIKRCVESVVNQTYENLEIILVDDGSPDNCPAICDEWRHKDERIKVIHKKNEGLGMARNTGMSLATGEYVMFCDSDDYISNNAVEIAYQKAVEYKADIVCYGFVLENDRQKIKSYIKSNRELVFQNKEDVRNEFIPGMIGTHPITGDRIGLWMSLCSCLISVDLIRRTTWCCESERNIISEDMYSLLSLYGNVDIAVVLKETLYHYCENRFSLSHVFRNDRFERIKDYYSECVKLCEEMGYSNLIKQEICQPFVAYSVVALKQLARCNLPYERKYEELKKIVSDEMMQEVLVKIKDDKLPYRQRMVYNIMKNRHYLMVFIVIYLKTFIE